jgi:hypothetical protein
MGIPPPMLPPPPPKPILKYLSSRSGGVYGFNNTSAGPRVYPEPILGIKSRNPPVPPPPPPPPPPPLPPPPRELITTPFVPTLLLPPPLFDVDLEYAKYMIIEAMIKNITSVIFSKQITPGGHFRDIMLYNIKYVYYIYFYI